MNKKHDTNLALWLADERFDKLLGQPGAIRLAVLRRDITNKGSLAEIAARFGVTKAAITRHARLVRELFPPAELTKG